MTISLATMFEHLPAELLHYVFMLLSPCLDFPNVLLVCKRWREACKQVIEMRKDRCFSAFRLESPLKWSVPKVVPTGISAHLAPSKRFGSTVIFHGSSIYVFGGATSMFTTFNDLWVYDLCTKNWKRLPGEGDLPTPRAHAKGGFIGDTLYLFGGCQSLHHPTRNHSGQINWLSDTSSFDTKRLCWSRVPLRHAIHDVIQSPPVNGGQSGCFLPASSDGDPNLLVLFGGISQLSGACVSDVCLVAPDQGRWFMLDESSSTSSWPSGRCGHAVCALDPFQMLVLFGSRESPTVSEPVDRSAERPTADVEESKIYQGNPAADVWILTRCRPSTAERDWRCTSWFWTKVQCPIDVPGCPPVDFYHAVVVRLPYTDKTDNHHSADIEDDVLYTCPTQPPSAQVPDTATYTVLCISQSTEYLLEEAAKQRRSWRQRYSKSFSHRQRPQSPSLFCVTEPRGISADRSFTSSKSKVEPMEMPFESTGSFLPSTSAHLSGSFANNLGVTDMRSSSSAASRRSVDRRAKRLEALAAQERRLFGSRLGASVDRTSGSMSDSDNTVEHDEFASVKNPLAVYSLRVHIAAMLDSKSLNEFPSNPVVGEWLLPKKSAYIDMINGPHDCLGFSCTFGSGCLFLFGGLCESDEPVDGDNMLQNASGIEGSNPNHWRPLNDLHESINASPKHASSSLSLIRTSAQTAFFYVLQPKGFAGTVV